MTAAPQQVVLIDGAELEGELTSVGADGAVAFRRAGQAAVERLKLDHVVRWGNPVQVRGGRTIVVLADGGRLVTAADWSGGAALRLDGDAIVVRSDTFDEVRLPRGLVRGVVFAQRNHPAEREALADRVLSDPSVQEAEGGAVVHLSNGDRLTGELTELGRGSMTIATDAGAVKLPLSRVEAVMFGSRQSPNVSRQPQAIVGLRDGSVVYVEAVRGDEIELVLELGAGVMLSGGSVNDVVALLSLGGRVVYLSDLEPAAYRHVPYLDVEWPYQRDRNVLSEPLVVGGKRYLKGLGMHSAARLTYQLDGKYRRFEAAVAVDDSAEGRGSVAFGVYLLRDSGWQEAYTSGVVRGGGSPQAVSIDVSGAQGLTLTVDYADRGDEMDRADWLDARLVPNF